jgi:hypothetical protein
MIEGKDPGLFHDDEGNTDDRRIAGWIVIIVSLVIGIIGVVTGNNVAEGIFNTAIWAGVALLSTTVAEKFSKRG